MSTKKDATPSVAPTFPTGSIDFNAVLANDKKGKTGEALLDGAVLVEPSQVAGEPQPAETDADSAKA